MKKLIIPAIITALLAYCFAYLKVRYFITVPACGFLFSALTIGMLSLRSPAETKNHSNV